MLRMLHPDGLFGARPEKPAAPKKRTIPPPKPTVSAKAKALARRSEGPRETKDEDTALRAPRAPAKKARARQPSTTRTSTSGSKK